MTEPSLLASSAVRSRLRAANTELLYASSPLLVHDSSVHVPMGAIVCVPTVTMVDVLDEFEPLMEQPDIVSQWLEVEVAVVVVVAEKKVVVVHGSAVCVWHSGSSSVVIWLSFPMVTFGHGGNVPWIWKPDGH